MPKATRCRCRPGALAGNVPVTLRRVTAGRRRHHRARRLRSDRGPPDRHGRRHASRRAAQLSTAARAASRARIRFSSRARSATRSASGGSSSSRVGELDRRTARRAHDVRHAFTRRRRSGGEFVYLRAQQPTGFFAGTVTRVPARRSCSGVLVTSDSVSVADVTGTGRPVSRRWPHRRRHRPCARSTRLRATALGGRSARHAGTDPDRQPDARRDRPHRRRCDPGGRRDWRRARHVGHHRLLRGARSCERDRSDCRPAACGLCRCR